MCYQQQLELGGRQLGRRCLKRGGWPAANGRAFLAIEKKLISVKTQTARKTAEGMKEAAPGQKVE